MSHQISVKMFSDYLRTEVLAGSGPEGKELIMQTKIGDSGFPMVRFIVTSRSDPKLNAGTLHEAVEKYNQLP